MQNRMALFDHRPLTAGEANLARLVFADRIDYAAVRIQQLAAPLPLGAMVPFGRTILFGGWRAPVDFAHAPLQEQGWFIHELAHVWQAANGVVLALAKLGAIGHAAYHVDPAGQKSFEAYNIEQQAEIARFVFHARSGWPKPNAPPSARLEALWPIPRPAALSS